jgi:membrane protease YdiL (CAAX protease family)
MFNRYWRSYPWYFQLLQFIILIAVMASFFVFALTPLLMNMMGVAITDITSINENSPRRVIDAALLFQFFSAIGIFLLPALLFGYFTHPRPARYLGLVKPGNTLHWLLAILIMFGATPLFLGIAELVSHLNLGEAAKKAQDANDQAFKGLLSMTSPFHLIVSIIVLAILPGLSEELFFRGVLMRFVAKRSQTIYFPIIVSALMFALMHSNVYGLPSIFLAGCLLALIYYLTGSLWCSIIAHMFFNGLQVVITYLAKNNSSLKAINDTNSVPLSWVLIGAVIFAAGMYMLWKTRTPLPADWSADYTTEELMEGEQ